MFKPGEIVKYSAKFCSPGEEYYIHMVKEVNPDTKKCLIVTLNSFLTLGSSEMVDFDMIQPAEKFAVILDRNTTDRKYLVTDTKAKEFFAGYDFMGSVNWTENENDAEHMEKEYAEQIAADLESAEI